MDKLPDDQREIKTLRHIGKISDVFNRFRTEIGPSLSIEEINEVAKQGWAGSR